MANSCSTRPFYVCLPSPRLGLGGPGERRDRAETVASDLADPAQSKRRNRIRRPLRLAVFDVLMARCNDVVMATTRRTTLYLDPDLHKALRMKAAVSNRSLSDLVNEAVRAAPAEDAADLAAFEERASEPDLAFEDVLRDLKRRGKL